jgi:hypothetical protein
LFIAWQFVRLLVPGFVIIMAFTKCRCCLVFFNSSSFFITFVAWHGWHDWLAGKKEKSKPFSLYKGILKIKYTLKNI